MTNPYKILGVDQNATDEQIKAAYRELARKYHPDKYAESDLKDVAEEKMKEINEAYDEIMKMRSGKSSGNSYSSTGSNSTYTQIRVLINKGQYFEAEKMLNAMPSAQRGAEWDFLMGCIMAQKGWFFDAQQHFQRACAQDPSNMEYRSALNNIGARANSFGSGYRTNNGVGNGDCDVCSVCQALWCADCCCECIGGDLIRCC